MASLQYSCTVLTTNHRISPSRRRFQVSCNGGEKPIDRRNMLLGMGGLYSAANLQKLAHADPIPPPDFNNCILAEPANRQGKTKQVDCCPPPATYTDYIIPAPPKNPRVRKAVHTLQPDDPIIQNYEKAIQMMRDLDTIDPLDPRGFTQQAKIHCAYCDGAYPEVNFPTTEISVHYSWIFFPFHRWYLYFYERILGSLIGDDTFALPYWNWDNPDGMYMPSIFNKSDSPAPLFDIKRDQRHLPPALVDLTLSSQPATESGNLSEMYNEMIGSPSTTTDFMGQEYRAGDPTPETAKGGTSERGSHISVHAWVGDPNRDFNEDMGNFYSAGYDPLFYCHHSNVDRMWTIWRTLDTPVPKDITDKDYLNASFLFYNENKKLVRVKASDCLDPATLGYSYAPMPTPWIGSRAPKKTVRAKFKNLSKRAESKEKVFPLTLTKTTRVLVPKTTKGKADEVLVVENIVADPTKLIKFNVFVNDEDDKPQKVDRAEYAGSFAQLAQSFHHSKKTKPTGNCSFNLSLKELYENIDIDDDDTAVVVTLCPVFNGQDVTIGGIKIVKASRP